MSQEATHQEAKKQKEKEKRNYVLGERFCNEKLKEKNYCWAKVNFINCFIITCSEALLCIVEKKTTKLTTETTCCRELE